VHELHGRRRGQPLDTRPLAYGRGFLGTVVALREALIGFCHVLMRLTRFANRSGGGRILLCGAPA